MADGWERPANAKPQSDGWERPDDPNKAIDLVEPTKNFGKNFVGGLDAALSMGASIPSYLASGLGGLGTLMTGGSLDEAAGNVKSIQESNFGLGAPKPFTQAGQEVMDMISEGTELAKDKAGMASYKSGGGEAGRANAEFATEALLNFLPIPGGKAVRKLGKGIEKRYAEPVKPAAPAAEGVWERADGTTSKDWGMQDGEVVNRPSDLSDKAAEKVQGPKQVPADPMAAMAEQLAGDKLQTTPDSAAIERMAREMGTFDSLGLMDRGENASLMEGARARPEMEAAKLAAEAEAAKAQEPIYVDPQGQAFRGDPNSPEARLGLEKQTQAMDRELTHLQGKGTPEGEPLRPLQDHELNQRRIEAAEQHAKLVQIEEGLNKLMQERGINQISPGGRQTGAVNPAVFREGFEKIKEIAGGFSLRAAFNKEFGTLDIEAIKNGKKVAGVEFSPIEKGHPFQRERAHSEISSKSEETNLKSNYTRVDDSAKGNNLSREMYKFASELGNDISRSQALTNDGKKMWDKFDRHGLSYEGEIPRDNTIRPSKAELNLKDILRADAKTHIGALAGHIPLKQRGAVGRDLSARVESTQKRNLMGKQFKNLGLDEWDTIRDKDVALELSKDAKDISIDLKQRNLVSGLNMEVALSNNPLLKFSRTVLRDARTAADKFSRTFITDPKVGLTPVWNKMNSEQKVKVMKDLMEADKRQVDLTPELMDELGFDKNMKQFAETFRNADNSLLGMQNKMAEELGLKPTDRRTGHFPGIFVGSYKSLAVVGEGAKKRVVAVLATDTKAQHNLAKEHLLKEYPEVKFVEQGRSGLSAFSHNKYYSDIFSGWKNVLDLLGREDSRFSDVQDIVDKALLDANNALFNFNVHELAKKGVIGNEGNKPWLNPKQNANEAFSAIVRYFEEGALHHTIQKPLKDIKDMMTASETDHMPRARKYMMDYLNKVHQQDVNDIGKAINTLLDEPFKYIPTMTWDKDGLIKGKKKFGIGVGPGEVLKLTGALKNNMSQLYMGWFNGAFTLSQFAQPLQTGMPFLQMAASRIGASPEKVVVSLGKGFTQFMGAFTEKVSGKKLGLDPVQREAFQYAIDRGLFEFSEIEKAYQGTQNVVSRAKDRLAEANMKLGEQGTRTPMFMSFVDLLVGEGMEKQKAFEIAENLTQGAMIDYHQWERPMVYSKLGVMGGFAAGLTTFKHGFVTQQTYLAKQAIKPAAGKRSDAVLPIVYSVAAMAALTGITGVPFYSELDWLHREITDKFAGGAKSIREAVLANNPEWLNSGMISAATNMNWQSKFSSSDMIPDSTFKALSPHLEGAYRIGKAGVDMATERDAQSVRNFATAATPSGWKGIPEAALAKDEDGNLIGKNGLPSIYRTPEEWETRKWTGMRSQREALEREQTWDARLQERADTERRKAIHSDYERRLVNDNLDEDAQQKLEQEYMARKGDVRELLQLWQKVALDKQKTEKERLEGTPNTMRGLNRWEYYNK